MTTRAGDDAAGALPHKWEVPPPAHKWEVPPPASGGRSDEEEWRL